MAPHYMAKYAAKGEPRSASVSDIFKSCIDDMQSHGNSSSVQSALQHALIRDVGERDFSGQETAHMLLNLPLTSCTYSFATLSLTGITEDQDSHELVIQLTVITSSLCNTYSPARH